MSDDGSSTRVRGRTWRALGLLAVLGAVAGLAVAASSRPVYTATAQSYVSTTAAASATDLQQGNDLAQRAEQSYASLALTPRVLDPVISTLGLKTTADLLAKQVAVDQSADTAVLRISASDPSASQAAAIVAAVQTELTERVAALTPSKSSTKLTSISRPVVPDRPSSPNAPLDIALGVLGGAVVWSIVLLVKAIGRHRPPGPGATAAPSML